MNSLTCKRSKKFRKSMVSPNRKRQFLRPSPMQNSRRLHRCCFPSATSIQSGKHYRSSRKVRKANSGVSDIKDGVYVSEEDVTKNP